MNTKYTKIFEENQALVRRAFSKTYPQSLCEILWRTLYILKACKCEGEFTYLEEYYAAGDYFLTEVNGKEGHLFLIARLLDGSIATTQLDLGGPKTFHSGDNSPSDSEVDEYCCIAVQMVANLEVF